MYKLVRGSLTKIIAHIHYNIYGALPVKYYQFISQGSFPGVSMYQLHHGHMQSLVLKVVVLLCPSPYY